MTTGLPPTQQFTGIFYNPSFWTSGTSSLTRDVADTLYLEKTTPDTATALQTFSGGLSTQSQTAPSLSTDVLLYQNQTAGAIKLGTAARSVCLSNIDCQGNAINNASTPTTGAITIGASQTSGTLSIGAGALRTNAGAITIGANDMTLNLGGYITPTYSAASIPVTSIGGRNSIVAVSATGAIPGTLFLSAASSSNAIGTYLVTMNSTITCTTAGTIISSFCGVRNGSSADFLLTTGPTNITAVLNQVYHFSLSGLFFTNPATTLRPFITTTGTAVATGTSLSLTITRIA